MQVQPCKTFANKCDKRSRYESCKTEQRACVVTIEYKARQSLRLLSCLSRFELPEGMQRDKFLETDQVAWITMQPKNGLPLRVTTLTPQ